MTPPSHPVGRYKWKPPYAEFLLGRRAQPPRAANGEQEIVDDSINPGVAAAQQPNWQLVIMNLGWRPSKRGGGGAKPHLVRKKVYGFAWEQIGFLGFYPSFSAHAQDGPEEMERN